ncbi:hypothetical protein CBL_07485 [Carabus blaptoides fortunei]
MELSVRNSSGERVRFCISSIPVSCPGGVRNETAHQATHHSVIESDSVKSRVSSGSNQLEQHESVLGTEFRIYIENNVQKQTRITPRLNRPRSVSASQCTGHGFADETLTRAPTPNQDGRDKGVT